MILHDLRGVGLGQRSAEDGEVLREGVDRPALHAPDAGDHAVAGDHLLLHAEVAAAVGDELVELLERAGVEEQFHPLAGGQLARLVLLAQARLAAAQLGELLEVRKLLGVRHGGSPKKRAARSRPRAADQAASRQLRAYAFTTGFLSSPTPCSFTVNTSPGARGAIPDGVPVERMSPGSSVMMADV